MSMPGIQCRQIPQDAAASGWYAILPEEAPRPALAENGSADVVIIGAGFAGLAAARRLLSRHESLNVVLLEAQRIAWGACGRNSGFMIDLPHRLQSDNYSGTVQRDLAEISRNRFAIDFVRDALEEFSIGGAASDMGRINAAAGSTGMKSLVEYAKHLENLHEPYTRLDAGDLHRITGTNYYHGGIHMPGCLVIQPAAYIRGIAHGLEQCFAGRIRIFECSAAREILPGDSVEVVTDKGRIRTQKVILTVNGHLESFGFARRRLMHILLSGSMTRELSSTEISSLGGAAEWGITPAHPMGSTVRRLRENRIVIRNHINYNPARITTALQLQAAVQRHRQAFQRRFPMLPEVEFEHRWSGHLCLSRNDVPVFGEVAKNVYSACCQNGLGTTRGTFHGVLIADHVMGFRHAWIDELLTNPRPERLLPEPLMSMGAGTYLWWAQRRAGRDL